MGKKQYACGTYRPEAKYHDKKRKSPPFSATDCVGHVLPGNDGNDWVAELSGKSVRWVKLDGKNKVKSVTKRSVAKRSVSGASRKKASGRKSSRKKASGRKSSRKKASGRKSSGRKSSRKKASGRKSSRKKASGRKSSRKKASGRKSSRKKASRKKASRKQSPARKRSKASRKASRKKAARKQKNVNIDVIFYGQPYYNAVMKGDFTKINKHINEFNKLFKRKIGQSGPYGEHVIYSINPTETNKFKKKAREIFGKLKLHVSFNTSKSLKYLDKPSGR